MSPTPVHESSVHTCGLLRMVHPCAFLTVPAIKTEPTDEYDPTLICSPAHGGLGSQPYYPQHPRVAESPSCLVATMAPCQQFRSGLSSPDARYQQQNPAAVLYQRSKSLSPSLLGYQQPALMATPLALADAHRSVLVHAGSQGQSPALLHSSPANQQASPVIHYSPTNQQLRCGSHQEFQHIMYCENFPAGTARPGPPPVSQGQRLSPGSYPTVIQQQNATSQRAAKNGPPVSDQKEVLPAGVTIKQEQNLDQTYLDDGKMLVFLIAPEDDAPSGPLVTYGPSIFLYPLGLVSLLKFKGLKKMALMPHPSLCMHHFPAGLLGRVAGGLDAPLQPS